MHLRAELEARSRLPDTASLLSALQQLGVTKLLSQRVKSMLMDLVRSDPLLSSQFGQFVQTLADGEASTSVWHAAA